MMPTMQGETTLLDLGANIECNSENLVQFAIMGAALARIELNRDRPSVGLLNVGEEELKGGDALKGAAQILRTVDLPFDFHGFIEGDDIAKGITDVVVTDGFSGNVVLKAIEGTSKLFGVFLRQALTSTLFARLGYLLARRSLGALRRKIDPRRYNGGVFLGLNGVCVKSHGGTDGFGFSHAIELAHDAVRDDLIGRISADVSSLVNISAQDRKTAVS
jgi:glycerol-3-phosphate acyltransferase PlsX